MKFYLQTISILICYCLYISFSFSFPTVSCLSNSKYPGTEPPDLLYVKTVSESILNITFDSDTEKAFATDDDIVKAAFDGMLSTLLGKFANEPSFHTRCLNKPTMNKSFRDSMYQYESLIIDELSISFNKKKSLQHNIDNCESSKRSAYKTAHNRVKSLQSTILSLRNNIQHYLPSQYWPVKLQLKYEVKQRELEDYEAELVDYMDREYTIKVFDCANWANGGEGVMTTVYRKMLYLSKVYASLLFCLRNNNKYYYNLVHDSGLMTKSYLQLIPAVFVSVYSKKFNFQALPIKVMTKNIMKPPNEEVLVRLKNTDIYLKSSEFDSNDYVDCRRTLAFYMGKIIGCYGNIMMKRHMDMYTDRVKLEWY